MSKVVYLPLDEEKALSLQAGDLLQLNGTLYTARDSAHKRLVEALQSGESSPFTLANQVIYYVGPAPAKEGWVIGPAGPTTSERMDPYTLRLLELGVRGLIGKGNRSADIKQGFVKHKAVYFATVGGAAALLARHIVKSRVIAYEDLGTEAIRELIVQDFPVIVVNDCFGGDAYETGREKFRQA